MPNLNQEQLRRLARLGAMARLQQLQAEETAIRAEFPELFGRGRRQGAAVAESPGGGAVGRKGARKRRRRRSTMSAEARKAVSLRMRRYWAERRKAKAAK